MNSSRFSLRKLAYSWPLWSIGLILLILIMVQAWMFPHWKLDHRLTDYFVSQETEKTQRPDVQFLETNLNSAPWQVPLLLTIQLSATQSSDAQAALSRRFSHWALTQPEIEQVHNGPAPLINVPSSLFSERYLLQDLNMLHLDEQMEMLWKAWQLGFVPDKTMALTDPTQSWYRYLNPLKQGESLPSKSGIWMEKDRLFFAIELSRNTAQPQREAFIQDFDSRLQEFARAQKMSMTFQWSSPAKIASYARAQMETKVQRLLWITGLAVSLFLFWVFRRVTQIAWVLLPVCLGFWGASLITQGIFGSLNLLTLAFGSLLIGVAVDFPIHVLAGHRLNESQTRQNWILVGMGGMTTLIGLASLGFLPIRGFKELALFCVSGLALALLVTFLMTRWLECHPDKSTEKLPTLFPLQKLWLSRRWSSPLGLAVWGGLLFGATVFYPPVWEDDLASLSPVPQSLLREHQSLQWQFHQPQTTQMLIVTASNVEQLLQKEEDIFKHLNRLQQDKEIAGFMGLAHLIPSQKQQTLRQKALPSTAEVKDRLQAALENVESRLPLRLFKPFLESVETSRNQSPLTFEQWQAQAPPALLQLTRHLIQLPSDAKEKPKSDPMNTAVQADASNIRGFIWLYGDTSSQALSQLAKTMPYLTFFDQRGLVEEIVGEVRAALVTVFPWSIIIMTLLLAVFIRAGAFKVIFTVTLAAILTLLTLAIWTPLSIFHGVAVILVMAMGVDYALFVRASRHEQNPAAKKLSVITAMVTTLIAFGLMFSSGISVLVAIGSTVFIGVLYSYWVSQVIYAQALRNR